MKANKNSESGVVKYDENRLSQNADVGMSRVDPNDIRPPSMLLIQKSSAVVDFETTGGKHPKAGQFFHTGELRIYDSFECYFLFAAKGKYKDRRKPEEGEKDQYRALAAMADDCSLFAMKFRGSSLFALSSLFGFTKARRRPMFSIRCVVETKELSGEKGNWFVPVVRISKPEEDPEKLIFLEDLAKGFETRGVEEEEDEDTEEPR